MGRVQSDSAFVLARLTGKQREVLDLLIEHNTSKQIARRLGISPHTVDQRIQFAKDKLGAVSRNEAALTYRRLLQLSDRVTYEESHVSELVEVDQGPLGTQAEPLLAPTRQERVQPDQPSDAEADYPVVPELFDGRYGTLIRLGAIIGIAVFLVILVLGGLAIFSQLSELMAA